MNQTPEDPYRSSESAREIAGLTPTDLCRNQCYVCTKQIEPAMGYFHIGHELEGVICMKCLPRLEKAIAQIREEFKEWGANDS